MALRTKFCAAWDISISLRTGKCHGQGGTPSIHVMNRILTQKKVTKILPTHTTKTQVVRLYLLYILDPQVNPAENGCHHYQTWGLMRGILLLTTISWIATLNILKDILYNIPSCSVW